MWIQKDWYETQNCEMYLARDFLSLWFSPVANFEDHPLSALGKIMAMLGWPQTAFALTKANLVIGGVEVLMNFLKVAL